MYYALEVHACVYKEGRLAVKLFLNFADYTQIYSLLE